MQAAFDTDGTLLLRIPRNDAAYLRVATFAVGGLRESKDASGHEHDDKGRFASTSGGGAKPKAKHGDRASALAKQHAELKQARLDTFREIKADAQAALDAHATSFAAVVDASNSVAFSGGAFEAAYLALDELIVQEYESPSDQFAHLKEIEAAAKATLAENAKVVPDEGPEDERLSAEQIADNERHLKTVIEQAKAGRQHLRAYVEHRREMQAIKRGEPIETKESREADDGQDWAALLEAWDESKHPRDGGKFASKPGASDSSHDDIAKPSSALDKLAAAGKAALGKASEWEHGAKDAIVAQVDKLPAALKMPVVAVFKAAYGSYLMANKAVDAVAKERGMTDDQRKATASALTTADAVLGMKVLPAIVGPIAGPVAAGAASFVPVASLGYLAYSTAKDPAATFRAAKNAVAGLLKKKESTDA